MSLRDKRRKRERRRSRSGMGLPITPEVEAAYTASAAKMPTLLAAMTDQPVTPAQILTARTILFKDAIDNGLAKVMADSLPTQIVELIFGKLDEGELATKIQAAFDEMIEYLEDQAETVAELLEDGGISEREALVNVQIGLKGEALKLYDAGQLTVGKLLQLQPSVVSGTIPTFSIS